jgi:HSP20 family protein
MSNGTLEEKERVIVVPAVNIIESADAFIVTLDIPGAAKNTINAGIENNTLSVKAEVVDASAVGSDHPVKQYRREFSLANDIELDSVDARFELGVLAITLKKKQQYVPKQIHIH